jgi:integrase
MNNFKTVKPNIAKRGNNFYVYLKINGKMKWFAAGKSIRKAQKKLDDLRPERNNGTYQEIKRIRFRAFADLWFESYVKTKVKPSTLKSYRNIIYNHLSPVFGDHWLTDISTDKLQKYIAKRLQAVKPKSKKKISPKTVINELVPLKEMLKHAVRWGYLRSSPAEYIEKPRVERDEMDILTPEEVNLFLNEVILTHKPFFMMAVLTGMRRGELLGLQWGDIDWKHNQIHVRQQLCNVAKKLSSPKSRYSRRRIDMSPTLVAELKRHKFACPPSEIDLVFCNPYGKFLDPNNIIKREFHPALRRAQIKRVRFHDLRHTNAALRIDQGQNIKYI